MLEEDADVRCVRRSASGGKGSSLVEAGGRIRCLGCFFFLFFGGSASEVFPMDDYDYGEVENVGVVKKKVRALY